MKENPHAESFLWIGIYAVMKDRTSDKIIFNHMPKSVVVFTNLYPPLQQPTHVEKYVAKVGDSY